MAGFMNRTTVAALIERYEVFFLDAYGVLVSSRGALPGAAGFLERLRAAGKKLLILSNDASRSVDTSLNRYRGFGLPLERDEIITSGMLLADHYAAENLAGAPTIVLGTKDSEAYVREAGGEVVAPDNDAATVLVVADDDGYDFLDTVNEVVTVLFKRLDRGEKTHLVLPNPDLLFLRGGDAYGITSGAIAVMLEGILRLRDPAGTLRFVPLGKPHPPIFAAGMARSPTQDRRKIVMVGDQLVTDIRGAVDFGLDSVFVETGVGRLSESNALGVVPTWVLPGVAAG
jgi:HAD superfamily hydrolase (TIGR01459 family)